MIEIISRDEVAVHTDVASTVDAILRGVAPRTELRRREDDGRVEIGEIGPRRGEPKGASTAQRGTERREIVDITSRQPARDVLPEGPPGVAAGDAGGDFALLMPRGRGTEARPLRVYPFGVSRNRLEQAIGQLNVPALVVRDQREADLVVTLKNYYRRKPQPLRDAEAHGTPVYVLRANTGTQMEQLLVGLFSPSAPVAGPAGSREPVIAPRAIAATGANPAKAQRGDTDPVAQAMVEAEDAISTVIEGGPPISLTPQGSYVRRLQHQLADRYNVASRSRGREPQRRVEVYRDGGVR
jgi:hypothetical protein